jgi:predicted TIM-barrel fold metal-dependent hydrolase
MLFDIRTYLGTSFDGMDQSVSGLLKKMDQLEIEKSLVVPFKPLDYRLDQANQSLSAAIQPYHDRLIAAARIDPWQPNALESLKKAVQTLGMRALFLDPWQEQFRADLEITDPLLNDAQANALPVMIASGFPWRSEALQVLKLALRWPGVSIIMTNGGQINISGLGQADVTLALEKANNLIIETAGVYRQDFLEESVQTFGAHRVVFGSGSPIFDQAFEVKRVELLKVKPQEKQAIQAGNALRLLGIH